MAQEVPWYEVKPGARFRDIKASGGPPAAKGDRVEVLFAAAASEADLDEGNYLESTLDPPGHFETILDDAHLLPGLVLTVEGMQAGGSLRRVELASEWAYADRGYRDIVAPFQTLYLDLILSTVEKV